MLTVTGLQKSYADGERLVQVLRELSFSCARGRSLAVTGASGSGKSTLLNILAATLAPDAGSVVVADEQREFTVHAMSVADGTRFRRRHVGYVHQFYNLIPTLTVLENVLLPLRLNKITDSDPHALMLLEQVGLSTRLDVFPQSLSGGEQQRVAVVRALVLKPLLVLADEPTGNLDAENSARVRDLLFASARDVNAALVIATHSEEVARRADARLRLELQKP